MIGHPNRNKQRRGGAARITPAASPSRREPARPRHVDHDYSGLLSSVGRAFDDACLRGGPFFLTDAADLNEVYLDALPSQRQFHNCSCCRRFIRTYGTLATINEAGQLVPVMWNPATAPPFYASSIAALADKVRRARVTSVFLTGRSPWGNAQTGEWSHMAVTPPASRVRSAREALTAGQQMALVRENTNTVMHAMAEYGPALLDQAIRLLESEQLERSEKFIGPVRWLRALHDWPKGVGKQKIRQHLLWRAVATAPEGFCHIKSSAVGPLLDDIAAGLSFADIQRKHADKLHPLRYQRPQAAPAAGNIAAAEKLFEKLGLAPALERRFARLDEVEAIWRPEAPKGDKSPGGAVFGHIRPKGDVPPSPVHLPVMTSTWEKFERLVLPNAERIEMLVPTHGSFIALTTAANADAPPLLKWDREDVRNAVAWYLYHGGSPAHQWRLRGGSWTPVSAIARHPNLWGDRPMPFLAEGVIVVIEGAADTRRNAGNALFPEQLREDVHGARATIEAYSKTAEIAGRDEASACGYDFRKGGGAINQELRVFAGGSWSRHLIDRWD